MSFLFGFLTNLNIMPALWFVAALLLLIQTGRAHHYYEKCESFQKEIYANQYLLDVQNKAIEEWKKKSDQQNIDIKVFKNKLQSKKEASFKQYKKINESVVPKECDKAIQWGIEQAKEMD